MTFYILLEGETPEVLQYDSGILGETTKTTFYPQKGFTRFTKIVNEFPDMLEKITILDETNKKYSPEQFLKKIGKLKLATM